MITYLADTSAVVRLLGNRSIQRAWQETLTTGLIAICDAVELEMLFSATSLADRLTKKSLFDNLFGWVPTPDNVWIRAHEIQQQLTDRGHHRSAGLADLVVAATAEANNLTVLHYDHDYDTVAAVTGQPTQWLAPPGSIS
ncbi:PIN domain nuclease [Nocardia stercoris]|uniref:Ribonuclease VapC n=1 Tax=Nocardia stercoris TaxID=2483361 RepID=A0A3M2KPX6_9NOCA|nr:PIN domain nuclease [Nocardia stercoris]RMI27712.1 PIN domain nuclease [Nocardia stercoris]